METETLRELMARFDSEHDALFPEADLSRVRWEVRRRSELEPDELTWARLDRVLQRMCEQLAVHADKEQRYVFPYLTALAEVEQGDGAAAAGSWGSVDRMAEAMRAEHEALLAGLNELAGLRACCPKALQERVGAVESALRSRIRFEDELLYPAAMAIEAR